MPNRLKPKGMSLINKVKNSINFNYGKLTLLKQNESTEVDRKTWLHVASATYGPTAMTLTR